MSIDNLFRKLLRMYFEKIEDERWNWVIFNPEKIHETDEELGVAGVKVKIDTERGHIVIENKAGVDLDTYKF